MPEAKKIKIEKGNESRAKATGDDEDPSADVDESPESEHEPGGSDRDFDPQSIKALEERLAAKTKEAEENYDRLLRMSAEFENYKKRTTRETAEFQKYANQSLIRELLPIVDNLELAIKSAADSPDPTETSLLDGVELTRREILKVFENFKVEPIEALGKPFDPNFHEAVMREESAEHPENTVVNELQKGYLMHQRLIRPAMVVVAMPKNRDEPS
ncbi:MAG: nucleotide exchange factor GrpE [Desulfobacterales bacterium]